MKKFFFIILFGSLFLPICLFAQADSSKAELLKFDFGADIVSRYIWRGIEFGGDPAVPQFQPYASLQLTASENHIFQIGAWGSYGFTGNYSENDLSFKYSFIQPKAGTFSATVNDYYYPYLNIPFSNFDDSGSGAHTIEAGLSYLGPEGFPISLLVSKNILNDVPGTKSLYVELGYTVSVSQTPLNFFVGAAQGRSLWHLISTDKFEICNVGVNVSKSIKITSDYSLPAAMSWIMNPHLKKTYLVFKVSL